MELPTELHNVNERLIERWNSRRVPVETSERRRVVLSGAMLKEALEFIAPDDDPKQLEQEVVIEWGDAGHSGAGYYVSDAEYPEEGSMLLGPESKSAPLETSARPALASLPPPSIHARGCKALFGTGMPCTCGAEKADGRCIPHFPDNETLKRQILSDPDDEPTAGNVP